MKNYALLLCCWLLPISVAADVVRLSEPVAKDAHSETFGTDFDATQPTLTLAAAVEQAGQLIGQPVLIKTKVAQVCQKKGCFFIAQEGSHALRVSFRDYGFFIPSDSGGKSVILAGELVEVQRTPAQAGHFEEDMGDGAKLAPGVVYEIIADGVRIPL